ncbi:hypothetical protein QYM36_019022 [Artemia franciscana]|uniref:Uncharacterized protein n=1 Tax=Artemia franciscana TaxID=6661 RepID=A0AA88KTY8_ARTSF|nr:hypothetical protein QYM36_019022 [Artemia franciscana]
MDGQAAGKAKNLMTKTSENGDNPYLGILEYRNTPVDGLAAPAQLLMICQLQSILPRTTNHLRKKVVPEKEFLNSHAERQQQQKSYYDRSAKPLSPHAVGDSVHIQPSPQSIWSPATIIACSELLQSYIVETEDGLVIRRKRKHLSDLPQCCPEDQQSRAVSVLPNQQLPNILTVRVAYPQQSHRTNFLAHPHLSHHCYQLHPTWR